MPEFERAITSDKVKRDNVFTWPLLLEGGNFPLLLNKGSKMIVILDSMCFLLSDKLVAKRLKKAKLTIEASFQSHYEASRGSTML